MPELKALVTLLLETQPTLLQVHRQRSAWPGRITQWVTLMGVCCLVAVTWPVCPSSVEQVRLL